MDNWSDEAEIRVGEKRLFTVYPKLGDGLNGLVTGSPPTVSLYDDTDTVVSGFNAVAATGWTANSRPDPSIWFRIDNLTTPLPPGVYTLVFSYAISINGVAGDVDEMRILVESIDSPHLPRAAKVCRNRLQETDAQLPDGTLLPEIDMMVRRIAARFSTVNLVGLIGADFQNYQDAIGILTAVKLRPGRPKRVPIGEIAGIKTDLQQFTFDTPVGQNAEGTQTLEATWAEEGSTALRGVAAIKALFAATAANISFSAAAGKRSKLEAEGIFRSSNELFNEMQRERLSVHPFDWDIWGV